MITGISNKNVIHVTPLERIMLEEVTIINNLHYLIHVIHTFRRCVIFQLDVIMVREVM